MALVDYGEIEMQLDRMLAALRQSNGVYLYGAGNRTKAILQMCNKRILEGIHILGFIVTDDKEMQDYSRAPRELDGKSVERVSKFYGKKEPGNECAVLVTVMECYHPAIMEEMSKTVFRNVYYLTDALERAMTDRYIARRFRQLGIPYRFTGRSAENIYESLSDSLGIHVFQVRSMVDARLDSVPPNYSFVEPIQAGAELAGKKIYRVTDMDGDNISGQNAYYNELTCLYWLWKNTDYKYSGICHYRRMFESDIALKPIIEGEAGAVLPSPTVVYPNLATYYLGWGLKKYYDEMLCVVGDLFPEYRNTAEWCAENEIFIPNNICIASRNFLDDYCKFLFAVVFEVEKRMACRNGEKQERCWLSEHVSTIYFMHCLMQQKNERIYFSDLVRYW